MAHGYFADLPRRTASDKIFPDKAFNIAKNLEHDRYQRGLASMVYNFFDKKPDLLLRSETLAAPTARDKSAPSSGVKSETMSN